VFSQHRAEVESFADGLVDDHVEFVWMTYADLMGRWEAQGGRRVATHVRCLRERYDLAIFE
jgi:hypothetical protein